MPLSPRILFAGGCHVVGYPVGKELSFATIAVRSISFSGAEAAEAVGYVNLRSGPRLAEVCRGQGVEFLVLQLGHYELMPNFSKIFRGRKNTNGLSTKECVLYPETQPDPDAFYQSGIGKRLTVARRIALASMLTALGQKNRIFDPAFIATSLDSFLSSLQPLKLRAIFLLSPFSCPDPVSRACRREAEPIFASAAMKHGCIYVDSFGLLESYEPGKAFRANFADLFHLSRVGHERVGRLLGESLKVVMGQMEPGEPVLTSYSPLKAGARRREAAAAELCARSGRHCGLPGSPVARARS